MNTGTSASALRAIADDKSMNMISIISRPNGIDGLILRQEAIITRKRFYSKLARLKKAGLQKKEDRDMLPTFGKIIHRLHGTIDDGLSEL